MCGINFLLILEKREVDWLLLILDVAKPSKREREGREMERDEERERERKEEREIRQLTFIYLI